MKIQAVDSEKCIKCGFCVLDCPSSLFSEKPKKSDNEDIEIIFSDPFNSCIACGHCLAICPTDAIEYEDADPCFSASGISNPQEVSYQQLLTMVRARRSIRHFKNQPIPKEEIKNILEAMRYAPSASNEQNWEFLVLTNAEYIQEFSDKITKLIGLTYKLLSVKLITKLFIWGQNRKLMQDPSFLLSMKRLLDRVERGEDPIFFKAPCVIVLHSPNYGNLAGCDAGISLTHGMLAAQARGLGSCWIGIAQETIQRVPKIKRWLNIPKGRTIWGILALGSPDVKYKRAPPRNPLKTKWKE
ncbi:MAG: nitroreductase family protein [Promethearchaeota archaeon]